MLVHNPLQKRLVLVGQIDKRHLDWTEVPSRIPGVIFGEAVVVLNANLRSCELRPNLPVPTYIQDGLGCVAWSEHGQRQRRDTDLPCGPLKGPFSTVQEIGRAQG